MHHWPLVRAARLGIPKGIRVGKSNFISPILVVALLLFWVPARAQAALNTCDRAATRAAEIYDVPLDVMMAITRVETGRGSGKGLEPWPWTVNMEGKGLWFATKRKSMTYVYDAFKQGKRSFDVGCFQINYRWHSGGFSSIDDMFDPDLNSQYAAKFLRSLYREHGSWTKAVGAYHSRTESLAKIYLSKFERIRKTLNSDGVERETGFKLAQATSILTRSAAPLVGGGRAANASLVPLTQSQSLPSLFRTK